MRAIDPHLARGSYLRSSDGRLRMVQYLDELMADVDAAGALLVWDDTSEAGRCYLWQRVIVLGSWVFRRPPWFVRKCIAHELAHAVVGPSEERVRRYEQERYGDLLDAPEWMA